MFGCTRRSVRLAVGVVWVSLGIFASLPVANAKTVSYQFMVEDWVVDFLRPTVALKRWPAERVTPFKIPDENRKAAILVNGMYPGPTVYANVNDTVEINVFNLLISEGISIHWHGIHPIQHPWADGAIGVSQAPIDPGNNFTYRFKAWPPGTHYWHSHMDGMQSAKGLRGPFIVRDQPTSDPKTSPNPKTNPNPKPNARPKVKHDDGASASASARSGKEGPEAVFPSQTSGSGSTGTTLGGISYDDERIMVLADEWRDPAVCLKLEGAMAGNDVCSDIEYASINGQVAWGDLQEFDSWKYPYPLIDVEVGKCYRIRIIMMASNAENYIVRFAGHNATLVSLDGVDVKPLRITAINMHIGERADVVICATQDPGYYPIELTYDYACTLTPGNFIPPGFHPVSSCRFYGFLHYVNQPEWLYGPPNSPKGTGGGRWPKETSGVEFDLTNQGDWNKTSPVQVMPEPVEPDVRYVISLGMLGPTYNKPTDRPLTKGRLYMDIDGRRWSWKKPSTPLLHTKGGLTCPESVQDVPVLNIPEDAENVEIVINNLSPAAHNIHMHGMLFQVINIANFQWCSVNATACFVMPGFLNPCPPEDRAYGDTNHTQGIQALYWGCKYNAKKDKHTQNLHAPLRKDSFQVWQRSWAVIRFRANRPGVWQFHCHMEQHIPLGMVMALNIKPSKQKKIPKHIGVPTEGSCPIWSDANTTLNERLRSLEAARSSILSLERENERLRSKIKQCKLEL